MLSLLECWLFTICLPCNFTPTLHAGFTQPPPQFSLLSEWWWVFLKKKNKIHLGLKQEAGSCSSSVLSPGYCFCTGIAELGTETGEIDTGAAGPQMWENPAQAALSHSLLLRGSAVSACQAHRERAGEEGPFLQSRDWVENRSLLQQTTLSHRLHGVRKQHQRQTTGSETGKGDTEQQPRNSTPSTNSISPPCPPWGLLFSGSLLKSPEPFSE